MDDGDGKFLTSRPALRSREKNLNFGFYVHGTVHLRNTSFIKYQRDATFPVYLVFITLHVSDAVCKTRT